MKRRCGRSSIVVVVAGVFLALLSGCTAAEEPPLSPQELVPVITQPQEPFDVLPAATKEIPSEGIDPASTRYLGSSEGTLWWVGVPNDEEDGSVCLIMTDPEGLVDSMMYACMTPAMMYDHGTIVSSMDFERGAGAYLLPNDVDVAPLRKHLDGALTQLIRPEGMTAARAMAQDRVTLITFRPQEVKEASVTLDRTSGDPINLTVS